MTIVKDSLSKHCPKCQSEMTAIINGYLFPVHKTDSDYCKERQQFATLEHENPRLKARVADLEEAVKLFVTCIDISNGNDRGMMLGAYETAKAALAAKGSE